MTRMIFVDCLGIRSNRKIRKGNNINGKNNLGYDSTTINSVNSLSRLVHRSRVKKGYEMVLTRLSKGKLLDYGCGTWILPNKIRISNNMDRDNCYGYEPIKKERCAENLPIFSDYNEIIKLAPFATITVFEVLEHFNGRKLVQYEIGFKIF